MKTTICVECLVMRDKVSEQYRMDERDKGICLRCQHEKETNRLSEGVDLKSLRQVLSDDDIVP